MASTPRRSEGTEASSSIRAPILAAAVLLLVAPAAAQPAERPSVAVVVGAECTSLDAAAMRRILAIELGDLAELVADPIDATATVDVGCIDPRVTLDLRSERSEVHLSRELDALVETGRSRVVAIAIAELVAAGLVVVHVAPPPVEPDVPEPVVSPEVAPEEPVPVPLPSVRPEPYGVRFFGVARVSGEPFHFSGGGGIGFDASLVDPIAVTLDARLERGSVGAPVGDVDLTGVTLGTFLTLRAPFERSHADIGVGARSGVGLLEGDGPDGVGGGTVVGPIVSIAAETLVSIHVVGSAYVHVGIELGWTFATVTGTFAGEPIARLGGAYLSISAGIEFRPSS